MKTYRINVTTMASLFAITLLAPLAGLNAREDNDRPTYSTLGRGLAELSPNRAEGTLQIAPANVRDRGLAYLAGDPVRGSDGEQFGFVSDFLVDLSTSEVVFALVNSSSSAGQGTVFRLIPFSELERSSGGNMYTLQMDRVQWQRVQALTLQEVRGQDIILSAERLRQVLSEFPDVQQSLQPAVIAPAEDAPVTDSGVAHLTRISGIQGRAVRSGDQEVGQIEDIIIQEDRTAAALLDPTSDFAESQDKFLVPVHRLKLGAHGHEFAASNLTRADFDRAQLIPSRLPPGSGQTSEATPDGEPALSPTGRPGDSQNAYTADVGASASLTAAVKAVRQALENADFPSASQANVQVVPENGKIVLRGSVENQEIKSDIESRAQQAAPDADITSRIAVENE